MLLDAEKGETHWSIDRLWEYQRGYIGPSMWHHFVGRFGMIDAFVERIEDDRKAGKPHDEELKREFDQRAQAFREAYVGALSAGPFVVTKPVGNGYVDSRIFVVVSVSPREGWPGQLAQQYVYEIDDFAKPCSVLALPHNAYGWAAAIDEDGVTLALSQGAMARFTASERIAGGPMPGQGSDCTTPMPWYREIPAPEREAWMTCDPARDAVDVEARLGVRVAGGGWIAAKGEQVFHFPLWLLDPRSGTTREVELLVPFDGRVEVPESSKGKERVPMHTWGWNGLALSGLRLNGDRLLVWLGNRSQLWCLDFDASGLAATE